MHLFGMKVYQYPLKIGGTQRDKLQKLAEKERRSVNQTILLIVDKFLEEVENAKPTKNKS